MDLPIKRKGFFFENLKKTPEPNIIKNLQA